jgi:imidazolonepropionase-like amidohydrolase
LVVGRCRADHLALRTPPDGRRHYAVAGATVHPVSGPEIPNGVVLWEGERIRAVGRSVNLPAGTHVLDGRGLHVYPGLIDAGSQLGLVEVGSVRGTVDTSEAGELQPDVMALPAVHPASEHIAVTRFQGITAALTRPSGAMVTGQSALIQLSGWTPDEMQVRSPVALHVNFPQGLTSLPYLQRLRLPADDRRKRREEDEARMRRLRELFDRAKRYAAARSKAPDETPYDPRLAAMAPYVAGQRSVVFHADSAAAIREALQFAEEVGVKPILASGREAWKVADLLARKRVPVIYGPMYRLPYREEDPYDSAYAAPALLHRAGVAFCFQSNDAAMARDLPYQVGIACAYGLPREAGLRALTLDAARILGVGDVMGSLEPGKLANVIVTDGDPFEPTTSLHALYIAGRPILLESKHTRLYQLYRQRLSSVRTKELAR